jgi:hypothetical protein
LHFGEGRRGEHGRVPVEQPGRTQDALDLRPGRDRVDAPVDADEPEALVRLGERNLVAAAEVHGGWPEWE